MAKRVLVVDDEPNTRKYVSVLLEENGYEAATACDGADGLEKLKESKPDLIVLDVMMPRKSGLTLFKQLKKNDELKDIPILMLTGVAGVIEELEEQKDDTFEQPFDNLRETLKKAIQAMREHGDIKPEMFVDKPVDPEGFIAKVQGLIGS
jgi:CheY-like chemotaxis protein